MRLNNTRQALFFLLLLSRFSPPSTSSCPQSRFSTGFILRPTLFLYLSLHFYPSLSHPFLLICMSCPKPPQGPFGSPFSTSREFYLIFDDSFCKPVPFKVHVLFYCFCFALLCCFICCQVRLPVFVTHICKSLFKDNTLLFNFFLYLCVYEQYIVHASVGQF